MATDFKRAYNSFSGCDIRATFHNKVIGTLQGISWSVTREKAPIYTMGHPDPRAFARGKRGIAGSLIFIQFDNHALLETLSGLKFSADVNSFKPDGIDLGAMGSKINSTNLGSDLETIGAKDTILNPTVDQVATEPWFSDQIPPFDVTLAAANEYGHACLMRIYGVEILNEGSGVSIDDIVLEQQMTFIARSISPWTRKVSSVTLP
jgi:hypothetical protein